MNDEYYMREALNLPPHSVSKKPQNLLTCAKGGWAFISMAEKGLYAAEKYGIMKTAG